MLCFLLRHWQDLSYLIIYITGRPDMQKQRVVSWLSQHNFPQGMIFFSEGLVHDPLRQKTIFLRNLIQEVESIFEVEKMVQMCFLLCNKIIFAVLYILSWIGASLKIVILSSQSDCVICTLYLLWDVQCIIALNYAIIQKLSPWI